VAVVMFYNGSDAIPDSSAIGLSETLSKCFEEVCSSSLNLKDGMHSC